MTYKLFFWLLLFKQCICYHSNGNIVSTIVNLRESTCSHFYIGWNKTYLLSTIAYELIDIIDNQWLYHTNEYSLICSSINNATQLTTNKTEVLIEFCFNIDCSAINNCSTTIIMKYENNSNKYSFNIPTNMNIFHIKCANKQLIKHNLLYFSPLTIANILPLANLATDYFKNPIGSVLNIIITGMFAGCLLVLVCICCVCCTYILCIRYDCHRFCILCCLVEEDSASLIITANDKIINNMNKCDSNSILKEDHSGCLYFHIFFIFIVLCFI